MRLDKYLSQSSDYSRKEIKKAIRQKAIEVNGETATDPGMKISEQDDVVLYGIGVDFQGKRYFMMNKPEDVVSVTRDGRNTTALDLLEEPNKERLHVAGRLDKDATGLLLITDDGVWTHQVISPRKHCTKVYHVWTAESIDESMVEKFAQGIWLESENKRTLPAELQILSSHEARLSIQEGRYHQVKRMFAAQGNRVVALHREQIGEIRLDLELADGEYRSLTQKEIDSVW
ncbi:MAG: pseudouridine synthase [Gammaproteobacteria bacterium]|nr:pseudouridine synthase [Gammaproteobacteria bacterium]